MWVYGWSGSSREQSNGNMGGKMIRDALTQMDGQRRDTGVKMDHLTISNKGDSILIVSLSQAASPKCVNMADDKSWCGFY